jgi:hypothetical protein
MGIRAMWDDEGQTTLRYVVEGRWTWDEFYAMMDESRRLMDSAPNSRIDMIVDMTSGNFLPHNALSHFGRLPKSRHPKAGILVLVGPNAFIRSLVNVIGRLSARSTTHLLVADTMEDARQKIAERRSTPAV